MCRAWGGFALAAALLASAPTDVTAQVFVAASPRPDFTIGPVFVGATAPADLAAPVNVSVTWNLVPLRGERPSPQRLALLWPGTRRRVRAVRPGGRTEGAEPGPNGGPDANSDPRAAGDRDGRRSYAEIVELWLDGSDRAGVGVSVGTSVEHAPARPGTFRSLATAFPHFSGPGQRESIIVAVPDFPQFAQHVREIVWSGL